MNCPRQVSNSQLKLFYFPPVSINNSKILTSEKHLLNIHGWKWNQLLQTGMTLLICQHHICSIEMCENVYIQHMLYFSVLIAISTSDCTTLCIQHISYRSISCNVQYNKSHILQWLVRTRINMRASWAGKLSQHTGSGHKKTQGLVFL